MNVNLIVHLAQTRAKDSAITYDEFDELYSDLSRKEQYEVANILYDNGIDLIDEHIEDGSKILEDDYIEPFISNDEVGEGDPEDSYFKDPGFTGEQNEGLIVNTVIHQSDGILCSLIQQGNKQAAQDLCIKNKALVDKYANAYRKKYGNGLAFEDLEQAGFIGLLTAAEKFDANVGAFSTYAVYWIKQAISREIFDTGFLIRIPVHIMERINKVAEMEYQCPNDMHFDEKIEFIALSLHLSQNAVRECFALRSNVLSYTSLSTLVGEDEEAELGDFLPAEEDTNSVETTVMSESLRTEIDKILRTLTERESKVLKLRAGWDTGKPMTLEQVSKEFNVTRERIRQIEGRALRKLRHPSRSKLIHIYLEV